ncbi:MAG: F0F1 ATP synthase subunit B [Acidobacteriota bacterium]
MKYRLLALVALLSAAVPVSAQEAADGGLSPFAGDIGNAVWTLVVFVLVVLVLGKFAWRPILSLLQQREDFIHQALTDAKRDREDAEARLQEMAAKLQAAQGEALHIIEEARRDAERLREELKQKARTEADQMVRNAERQIQLDTTRALQQIRKEAVDISVAIATKIVQRNITREDNERLIDDTLKQMEAMHS